MVKIGDPSSTFDNLNLSSNRLISYENRFINVSNLDLRNNYKINIYFTKDSNIETLNLSDNTINIMGSKFSNLTKMIVLILKNNDITSINELTLKW